MSTFWVLAALAGLGIFLYALVRAAWSGREAGRRWLAWALGGFVLLALGLRLAGTEEIGVHYPPWEQAVGQGGNR